ncbi:hypothetical protein [Streptomyces sp. CA-106131]|uniref:hypothetical protein n=1 Tax=Streptomyces sp. CA-106131 TaxID=3240045 RepID=UPI003D8B0A7E
MDAGTAAVLGALAGSVATIGAALATGWAQREGARITARSEHRRQRREPRHGAYKAFIAEASGFRDYVGVFTVSYTVFPYDRVDVMFSGRCEELADAVREKWVDVALAGPKKLADIATSLERLSNVLVFRVVGLRRLLDSEGRTQETSTYDSIKELIAKDAEEFESELDRFISVAQATLDDDGSLK